MKGRNRKMIRKETKKYLKDLYDSIKEIDKSIDKLQEYRDRVGCVNGYTLHIYVKESDSEIPHFHIKHKN